MAYILETFLLSDDGYDEGSRFLKLLEGDPMGYLFDCAEKLSEAVAFEDRDVLREIAILVTEGRYATGSQGPTHAGFRIVKAGPEVRRVVPSEESKELLRIFKRLCLRPSPIIADAMDAVRKLKRETGSN